MIATLKIFLGNKDGGTVYIPERYQDKLHGFVEILTEGKFHGVENKPYIHSNLYESEYIQGAIRNKRAHQECPKFDIDKRCYVFSSSPVFEMRFSDMSIIGSVSNKLKEYEINKSPVFTGTDIVVERVKLADDQEDINDNIPNVFRFRTSSPMVSSTKYKMHFDKNTKDYKELEKYVVDSVLSRAIKMNIRLPRFGIRVRSYGYPMNVFLKDGKVKKAHVFTFEVTGEDAEQVSKFVYTHGVGQNTCTGNGYTVKL